MWCVGALAPWLAQGAGQLRRQGGSTCHPARPVITTSAVVLTRPPVPCHMPHQPQKQPPSLRVVLLSSLCRRRLLSSPSSFAVAVLLSFLCRRGLFCRFSSFAALPAAPCSSPPFAAAACLLPPLQAPSGTGAGTAGGAARGPVGGGGPVGAYRHLRLDPALLLAPVAAPRAALAPVGGARCVHCQPGQGHLRWSKEGGGATSRRGGGCKNNH